MWVTVREKLSCQRKRANSEDSFAVVVMKGKLIIGHLPTKIFTVAQHFYNEVGQFSVKLIDLQFDSNALSFLKLLSGLDFLRKNFLGAEIFTNGYFIFLVKLTTV